MPELGDAIKITATDATAAMPSREGGTPAIVGESAYTTKETPKLYYSLADVKADHGGAAGASTDITVAAADLFAQGVRKMYVVAIDAATAGSPTATEVGDALDTLTPYASEKLIHGVCLAMITETTLLARSRRSPTRIMSYLRSPTPRATPSPPSVLRPPALRAGTASTWPMLTAPSPGTSPLQRSARS